MSFFCSSRRCSMILHYSLVWSLPENKVVVMVHILTSEIISVNQHSRNEGKTSEYWNNSLESSLFWHCMTEIWCKYWNMLFTFIIIVQVHVKIKEKLENQWNNYVVKCLWFDLSISDYYFLVNLQSACMFLVLGLHFRYHFSKSQASGHLFVTKSIKYL